MRVARTMRANAHVQYDGGKIVVEFTSQKHKTLPCVHVTLNGDSLQDFFAALPPANTGVSREGNITGVAWHDEGVFVCQVLFSPQEAVHSTQLSVDIETE